MPLLAALLIRIFAVVTLCLAVTTAWILVGTHRDITTATRTSADRAVAQLQALYWQKLVWRGGLDRVPIVPEPEWQSLATARVIAPGICIAFAPDHDAPHQMCSGAESVYAPAPDWFTAFYAHVFGDFQNVYRPLDVRQHVGTVTASVDAATALRLAWLQVGLMVETASLMALAIGLFIALVVTTTLLPVRKIVDGLGRLETGDYGHRIIGRSGNEIGRIAGAVNDLAGRLGETQAARAALTRQLFQVQEDERRALARDLHDEFGQCLAATSALAGSIQVGAADRPDLVAEARAIADATRRMMKGLKEALVRLRSQDIDDLGLEACLTDLVTKWNSRSQAEVHLDLSGDLADVPRPVAVSIYRIAQECLTNAARHGDARNIQLVVKIASSGDKVIALRVEDDGGGDPERFSKGSGHGLLGIRERIAALGGSLHIGRAARGIRVAAAIPFVLPQSVAVA